MKKKEKAHRPHLVLRSIAMVLATLLLAATVVGNVVAQSMSSFLEGFVGAPAADVDQKTVEATRAEAEKLAREAQGEGAVLLQNRDRTLPLSEDIKKVNVFGWASTAWIGGGSGSGGVSSVDTDLLQALENYGVEYNRSLTDMYRDFQEGREYVRTLSSYPEQSCRLYEPDIADPDYYSEQMLQEAREYSDTALVVLGRLSGESNDCTKTQYKRLKKEGEIIRDDSRTYLDLSAEEEALLSYAGANFDHVIVILNTGNVMTLGQLETIPGVDACLMAGYTGQNGADAIPEILWGDRNPSGRTTDTWAYDLATAASYANAGGEGVGAYTGAEGLYPADGTTNGNLGDNTQIYEQVSYVDYAEGIYIGYKWYETADAEHFWDGVSNEYGEGYEGVVQYPFGYGLSYTDFSWEITQTPRSGSSISGDDEISVKVKVTNTGKREGKDVVQLYYSAPYIRGEIEKSALELAAFAKTDVLQPGESQELELKFAVEEMASYDGYDSNHNGFVGYELDPGTYTLSVRKDAHTEAPAAGASVEIRVEENVQYPTDSVSGNEVRNRFTGEDAVDGVSLDGSDSGQNITYMTRADFAGTFPVSHVPSRPMTDSVAALNLYTDEMAEEWIDPSDEPITTGKENNLKIEENGKTTQLGYELGADYDDLRWEDLLDQVTIEEMENLLLHGYGKTSAVDSVGKILCKDADGPAQIGGFHGIGAGTGFPSSSTIAQSWNTELAKKIGLTIGTQAIQNGYGGWYAPAVNMHRSPLNGRNYEYYSEDSFLSGEMCGNTVAGSMNAGVYSYVKHFICNDQESGIYRDSIYTWMTEQTLREIYLEPFRILVEDYDAVGLMTSYNRIGAVWAGGSEALLTDILREEWGFKGAVITDFSDHHAFMNGDQMLRAGGTIWMDGFPGELTKETESASYQQALRKATKDLLYMYLHVRVVNQEYCEQIGDETLLRPDFTPGFWTVGKILAVIDVVVLGLFVLALISLIKGVKLKRCQKCLRQEDQ